MSQFRVLGWGAGHRHCQSTEWILELEQILESLGSESETSLEQEKFQEIWDVKERSDETNREVK